MLRQTPDSRRATRDCSLLFQMQSGKVIVPVAASQGFSASLRSAMLRDFWPRFYRPSAHTEISCSNPNQILSLQNSSLSNPLLTLTATFLSNPNLTLTGPQLGLVKIYKNGSDTSVTHTEKSWRNRLNPNQSRIIIALFRQIQHQSKFRLVLNLSENGNYNQNLVWINKFKKIIF